MKDKMFFTSDNGDYRLSILELISSELSDKELGIALGEYHYNDIAAVLEELEPEKRERVLRALEDEDISEIVTYFDDVGEFLSELEADEAADIIEQMDADDALEALDDLDQEKRSEIFELIEEEIKEDIRLLESYGDDELGSKMSTNFITVKRGSTVKEAMRTLISEAAENDNIHTLFVLDGDRFYGAVDLKELIVARSDAPFESLIYTAFPFVYDHDSISENIERLRGYSEDLIPVISRERELLGVITSKDVTEMVDVELGDDYAKLAALSSEEERGESIFASMKKRIPWLVALLFMGLAVSGAVGFFEGVVTLLPAIVCFQSLILGMAGNIGTQSLAVTVRALGSEENGVGVGAQLRIVGRETALGFLNGLAIGSFSLLTVTGYLCLFSGYSLPDALPTALCVGLALCFSMSLAGFTGAGIPNVLYRLNIDPAIASGPLITTLNDLAAVVSYYGLAWGLLLNFGITG